MYNQIDYANHAELLLNPLLENQLRFGEGHSYGFEFQAKKNRAAYAEWQATHTHELKENLKI
ncbi:MAG: hypothetical protein IPJ20_02785 [Flammeovirgaceae bacterium]|nr:hypothetical protein [Flammeovirgaceae bacterium]